MADATCTEEWRSIPGFEGHYEASNLGRIRSLKTYNRSQPVGVMRLHISGTSRYPRVTLSLDNRRHDRTVHSLVALAWLGPVPDGLQVRHLDDDPLNATIENLVYGTPRENIFDTVRSRRHKEVRKTHCSQGHLYDSANTRVDRAGKRKCRACDRVRRRAQYARPRL